MEHEELTQRANRQSGRADEARRARLILLLGSGHTWSSIRGEAGLHRQLYRALEQALCGGTPGRAV